MSSPGSVNVNFLITQVNGLATSNFIDPVANVRGDRVFIFHGSQDSTVLPGNCGKISLDDEIFLTLNF